VQIADGTTPAPAGTGGSTAGPSTNPTSNSFIHITGGTTTIDPTTLFLVDATGVSFTPNQSYSYRIIDGAGDQSALLINSPSQFTFVGVGVSNVSVTGGSAPGVVYLNFTPIPVPEPTFVFGTAFAGFAAVSWVRRKRSPRMAD
jgi:hypothetical protein